jgi:hypothetical protein
VISAAEIQALRDLGHITLTSTVSVFRIQPATEGPEGDDPETYMAQVATLPGWLAEITPAREILENVGGVIGVPELFQLFLPPDSGVKSGDQVVVDGSQRFTVEHTNDEDTYRLFLICTCRKLT